MPGNICNYSPISTISRREIDSRFKIVHQYLCYLAGSGGGGGSVSDFIFTDGSGFAGNVTDSTSTPTLSITTSLTTGSVPFIGASGALSQDNTNLFWDNTNDRLGIRTATPFCGLHVSGNTPTLPTAQFGSYVIQAFNNTSVLLNNNMYFDGTNARYLQNGAACWFQMVDGDILFASGSSGSAGGIVTFVNNVAMKANGQVSIGTLTPNANAVLQVDSPNKGFLPPRLDTTTRDGIVNAPAGLMIYNSTTNKLNFYNGTAWEAVVSA